MAVTQNSYIGNGSTTTYSFTFPYIKTADVKAQIDANVTTAFTLPTATTLQFNTAPANGAKIKIYRETDSDSLTATFYAGSAIKAEDLNENFNQNLYSTQEVVARYLSNLAGTMVGDLTMGEDTEIIFEGATDNEHETKITVVDPTADRTITFPDITGTVITTGDTSTISTNMVADGAITMAKLGSGTLPSNVVVTENNIAINSITASELADNAVDTAAIVDDAVTMAKLGSGALPTDITVNADNLVADSVGASEIAANAVGASELADNAVDTAAIADDAVTAAKIADAVIITNSEQAASTPDDVTFFTTAATESRYFNTSTGETIKDGDAFPDNDTSIATTAAINDRIIDLVDDVGGFVPIANETSFPAANPDVNNGTGTLVSIKTISSTRTPSGGTVTITNGAGTGNTVTITGCGSTELTAGFGIIVETTSTLHTYAFHRLVPKATEVTTVAGISSAISSVGAITSDVTTVADNDSNVTTVATNITNVNNVGGSIANVNTAATNLSGINNFAERYRVASSAPTGSLDEGDLYYNTSDNKLYRYDGSAWGEAVTAISGLTTDAELAAWTGTTNVTTLGTITTGTWNGTAIDEANILISNTATDGQFLQYKDNTDKLTWATVNATPEGTAIKSTGEPGGTKFLREDGDGTSSWQTVNTTPEGTAILSTGESGSTKFLREDGDGTCSWQTVNTTPEGTAILSTGESGGTKFLREDGDGTCSWAVVDAGITSDAQNNTSGGTYAGASFSGTNAENNTLIGYNAGEAITTGDSNTAFGSQALETVTLNSWNTAVGFQAAQTTSGEYNTAIGAFALQLNEGGGRNIAVGSYAVKGNTTGDWNTGIGNSALLTNQTSDYNVAVGFQAFKDTTGANNTAIGSLAGNTLQGGSNNTVIGYNAAASSTSASNEITLGDANITKFRIPGLNSFEISDTGVLSGVASTANATAGVRKITASTSTPSGGSDGDVWIKYTA